MNAINQIYKVKAKFKRSYGLRPEMLTIEATSSGEALQKAGKLLDARGEDSRGYPLYPYEELDIIPSKRRK